MTATFLSFPSAKNAMYRLSAGPDWTPGSVTSVPGRGDYSGIKRAHPD